jgi:hypothetical protein
MTVAAEPVPIRSTIPARLDRLGWSPFHTRMVAGLGAAWILDGLQITIASSVTGVLTSPETLDMTSTEIGLIAWCPRPALLRRVDRGRHQPHRAGMGIRDRGSGHGPRWCGRAGLRHQGRGSVLETVTKPLTAVSD